MNTMTRVIQRHLYRRDKPMRLSIKALLMLAAALIPACANAAVRQAFQPGGKTVLISATTTAATVSLNGAGGSLLVYNACTVPVRIDATGNAAATPAVGAPGSPGIPASTLTVIEIGANVQTVSVKVDSGVACNVEITRGEGMSH
jgi:hypothetical protein